jgi:hypothetical protein
MSMSVAPTGVGPAPSRDRAAPDFVVLRPPPAPDRAAVKAGAAKARSNPRFAVSDQAKAQARERVQQIVERLKILRKLFAGDPEAMARALAQVFKELKSAVQAYRKAGGEAFGLAASAAASVAGAGERPLQDAVTGALKTSLGEEGLQFVKELRALTHEIVKLLDTAKIQGKSAHPPRRLTEAMDDADRELTALRDALHDLEQDIRRSAPQAGVRLSVEA